MSTRSSQSRGLTRRGQAGVGLLLGGLVIGLAATTAQGYVRIPRPAVSDPQAIFEQRNVKDVVQALTRYAAAPAHPGVFPAADEWIGTLAQSGLLLGNVLPSSPWVEAGRWGLLSHPRPHRQTNELAPELALVDAARVAKGEKPSAVGTRLGRGHVPQRDTFDLQTYGALVYDAAPGGKLAVLYGIGQRNGEAMITSAHTLGLAAGASHRVLVAPLQLQGQSHKVVERAPNRDTLAYSLKLHNRASYEVTTYVNLFFEGVNGDDVLKVSGTRVDIPAGKTVVVDGRENLQPGEGARVHTIRCEHDGRTL